MILSSFILILGALIGGLAVYFIGYKSEYIRLPLVFAGSYLFSITIIHILPELFTVTDRPFDIGLFLLLGFFFQSFLEFFTKGIEHGHFHAHDHGSSSFTLVTALVVHSLLEGALLTHESPFHGQHESHSLLIGIFLHKAPAAYALMALYKARERFDWSQIVVLAIFAMASPLGMQLSGLFNFESGWFVFLYAFVSGNFLHISTTIFVETSPEHRPKPARILVSILAALIAVASQYLI